MNLPAPENPPRHPGKISEILTPVDVPIPKAFDALKRTPLSDREWVAVWFASIILSVIVIICAVLLWAWRLPTPAAGSEIELIDRYKALTAVIDQRTEKFFDMVITKALLPVFTTLIGFLLGRRSKED